ncbi:asparagine synthase (glutamine-hydrolyzing) [Anaerobranca gottschalkii]|uniref:asparagine synthase (glutamine-hydrolyzing) n=1 Tax=Anaerobranca gottschalkii DSM 13577 TaxID=1120990 RepID=A0A1I0BI06_9FIRM|nr:asparagine synthase (glutamine-hydrolyzing) [Anaerobranca gottschalkii]SET06508.1 asparagine synthase (glutamine-hydrolysing) [Anaerobranca gottschalkii DSM 13577]
MCGINGLYYFNQQTGDINNLIRKMAEKMIHRGPDSDGFYVDKGVALGFRRLSIIDIEGANQPLYSENGKIKLLCNGEIYNFKELRQKLIKKGHVFSTKGDAETIIHLYEEYGKDLVHHLRGMFAFILYDSSKEEFLVGRDFFGIKPLYYYVDEEKFACSSELKSLLDIIPSRELDGESLAYYLTYQYVPFEKTMVKNILKLLPGHLMIINKKGVKIERYWKPQFNPVDKPKEEYKEEIKEILLDSVSVHMQSDVPIGCFLSSGIDSTAIACLMSKFRRINTFSVGFEGPNNECIYSSQTAEFLNSIHHKWVIKEEEYFNSIPDFIHFIDEPVADPSAIALYLVSKLASTKVKVVLSGEGADELFAGYGIYQEPLALKRFEILPDSLKKGLNKIIKPLPNFYGKNYLLRGTTPLTHRFLGNAKIFTDEVKDILVNKNLAYKGPFELVKDIYEDYKDLDPVKQMQIIDIYTWLPGDILTKGDKMSMANSLELRVPFLDIEVFKVASQIPTEYSITPTQTKAILREALADIVPDFIVNRKKLGFPVPIAKFLRDKQGQEVLKTIKLSGIGKYINLDYIERLFKIHQKGKADYGRKLWTIYILALWYKMHIKNDSINDTRHISLFKETTKIGKI